MHDASGAERPATAKPPERVSRDRAAHLPCLPGMPPTPRPTRRGTPQEQGERPNNQTTGVGTTGRKKGQRSCNLCNCGGLKGPRVAHRARGPCEPLDPPRTSRTRPTAYARREAPPTDPLQTSGRVVTPSPRLRLAGRNHREEIPECMVYGTARFGWPRRAPGHRRSYGTPGQQRSFRAPAQRLFAPRTGLGRRRRATCWCRG